MKVAVHLSFLFVALLLITTSESKIWNLHVHPIFFAGTLFGTSSTIIYYYFINEFDAARTCKSNNLERQVWSSSNSALKNNKPINFLNLIGGPTNDSQETVYADGGNETELADILGKQIRILCLILTQPKNHQSKARAVRETWGQRCNVFYFVSTERVVYEDDPSVTTVLYEGEESRKILWSKTKAGFKHAYDNYFDDVDWFVKADDDTYLVTENLRLFLLDKDTSLPAYFGEQFILRQNNVEFTWMTGGPGYVLSKEALKRFVEDSFDPKSKCNSNPTLGEDMAISDCMTFVNVTFGDTRDAKGKPRFLQEHMSKVLIPRHRPIIQTVDHIFAKNDFKNGPDCCSDSFIGFHYVDESMMRILDFAINQIQPFGRKHRLSDVQQKDKILDYLKNKNVSKILKNPHPKSPLRI